MLSKSDLIEYFENGIKNTSEIKIGTEHEKFIYHKSDESLHTQIKEKPKKHGFFGKFFYLFSR